MPAGLIIYGGEVTRVIYGYEAAGRGTAGWQAAEAGLRMRFPDAPTNTIDAVMRVAREVVQTGNNYRQGGADYAPGRVPDVRGLEANDPLMPPGPPGGRRESGYWHEGVIEIIDPNQGDAIVQRFSVHFESDGALSRADFERALRDRGDPFLDRFIHYDQDRLSEYEFQYRYRIGGVYRGF